MKSKSFARTSNSSFSRSHNQGNQPFFGIQAKLSVGKPGDKYEKEADSIADKVIKPESRPNGPLFFETPTPPPFFGTKARLKEKNKEQDVQKKEEPDVQRQEMESDPSFDRSRTGTESDQKGRDREESIQKMEGNESIQKQENRSAERPLIDSISTPFYPPKNVQKSPEEEQVQTKCSACEALNEEPADAQRQETGKESEQDKPIQRKCDKCEEKEAVQKKENGAESGSDIESTLKSSKGSGTPMAAETTSEMSSAFGTDMSGVRIHTDSNAVQMNKELGARAFTNGNDVYFNQGEYNPGSTDGKHLLAHELTHTIQQGNNKSAVQKQEDPCATPPKEKGSKEKAEAQETVPVVPGCSVTNPPVEQPAEGQEKPEGEDKERDISATEGSPVDARQTNAPPADQNAPPDEKGISKDAGEKNEAAIDPCAIREQKKGAAPKGAEPAAAKKTESKEKEGGKKEGDKKDKKEGKGEEKDFMTTLAQKGPSTMINPNGDGEQASPKVLADKDKNVSETEIQLGEAQKTKASLNELLMSPTAYKPSENGENETALLNASASSFLTNGVTQATGILDSGLLQAQGIRESIQTHRQNLQSDITKKRARTSAFFSTARTKAKAKAKQAKSQLKAKHLGVVMQIEITAMIAKMVASVTHNTKQIELEAAHTAQLTALDTSYQNGYNKLVASGNTMGGVAQTHGNTKAADYKKNAVKKYEGFWDGYVTYNRQMARVNAAKEVGKQYKEGMVSQAKAQADDMLCGKAKDIEMLGVIFQKGTESLNCALLNSQESIEEQRKAAIMQANFAFAELSKNIDNSLKATLNQLAEKKAVQLQLINDYGIRQALAIEKDGELAIASALSGVNKAAIQLLDFLRQYKNTIVNNTAPDAEEFMTAQGKIQEEFAIAVTNTNTAIESAVTSSQKAIDDGASKTMIALEQLYKEGRDAGRELQTNFNSSIDALVIAGTGSLDKILTDAVTGITTEQQNAIATLSGIVTGISGLFTTISAGVDSKFTEADTAMRTGMQSTIDKELTNKICAEAEKAAKEVKPWWVSALKVLLVIIVIVVVALVIGPAVIGAVGAAASALAGSLGAGAALAGTIGAWAGPIIGGAIVGAMAGATIQVGNNLIDIATSDKKLTWDNVANGVVGAMIAGAIGGALGGFGGQFAQVLLGRVGGALGPGMKFAADFGINAAFDLVGGVLGDLAAGNPITWESILIGMAIGGAVQVSMGGLGALAKNSVNAPKVDGDGAAVPRTGKMAKVEDFAAKIQDFQGRMMEGGQNFGSKAGFGDKAFSTSGNKLTLAEAQSRIQNGEAFPTKPLGADEGGDIRGIQTGAVGDKDVNSRVLPSDDPNIRRTAGLEGAVGEINIKQDIPPRLQKLIKQMTRSVESSEDGFGSIMVKSISPEDLVLLSKWYGREIGVLQSPYYKRLRLVLGSNDTIRIDKGEVCVLHTHPVDVSKEGHFKRDFPGAGPHVEGVIDWSGNLILLKEIKQLPDGTFTNDHANKNADGTFQGGVLNPRSKYNSEIIDQMPSHIKASFMDENGNIIGYSRLEIVYEPKTTLNTDGKTKSIFYDSYGLPRIEAKIKVIE